MRGILAAALAIGAPARAGVLDEIEAIEPAVQEITLDAEALFGRAQPGGGYVTAHEALSRFEDLLYLHLVGEHAAAAEGLFALVTTGALTHEGLHRDAEWYLADSLFQLGNYETAESRFQVVADDPQHPFRDDAVRRLLEIHALTGDIEAFDRLYEDEILRGRVAPSDLITYSVARNFYIRGDTATARARFAEIPSTSAYYGKARYHLGTFAVSDGALDQAIPYFEEVVALPVDDVDDRRVHDLALLALGRIHYERGEYLPAADAYSRIDADSEYAADKLYEISWTFIRTQAWQDALRGIDIFLLAFPDHEYAAQLRVVKGKLHLAEAEYDDALATFEEVMAEYTPVRDSFQRLARAGEQPDSAYFQEVLSISRSGGGGELPAYAISMMQADPDLSRAISVFGTLDGQERTIDASEAILRDIELALAAGGSFGSYDAIRLKAFDTSWRAVQHSLALLESELRWQVQSSSGERAATARSLMQRLQTLTARASELVTQADAAREQVAQHELQMRRLRREALSLRDEAEDYSRQIAALKQSTSDDAQLDPSTRSGILDDLRRLQEDMEFAVGKAEDIEARVARMQAGSGSQGMPSPSAEDLAMLEQLHQLRLDVGRNRDPGGDPAVGRRLDAAYLSLERAQERLQGVFTSLEKVERVELARIEEQLGEQVAAVARQRADHARLLDDAEIVAVDLTREGFGRLEQFFGRSVLDADLGAVDVFWAQKLDSAEEITRIQEERQALLAELEQRFRLIEQKIGN